ncbi:glutathione peroxidase [Hydromonas duriensis]|uniref:Glutaredoxin-like protein n=1 Tax=Hydromonas duriensis TaxID=1527608 RepID=A0A4R6YB07_9BURK|nr:glutathione peroxidase [Hydromonas duriensis]TDR32769.1 glutaredoxin-like protein [Hydromonas duriensis]
MSLENFEGKKVPQVDFKLHENNQWVATNSAELFDNKTVVVFSLPGAFTPTCSSTHLPRYEELAPVFKAHGVDSILCVSVNDGFVMEAWGKDQNVAAVRPIADGNGEFTAGMGMLVDKSEIGFGKRSWRYSMLVKNGVVEKMFIEPNEPGDPFKVSDADTMLNYIAPNATKPEQVALFTKVGCPFCEKAKEELKAAGVSYFEMPLEDNVRQRLLSAVAGKATSPQMFVNGHLVGDAAAISEWVKARG